MNVTTDSPIFLTAKTKEELSRKMLANNMARSAYYNYQIMKDGKQWVAWFTVDMKREIFKKAIK